MENKNFKVQLDGQPIEIQALEVNGMEVYQAIINAKKIFITKAEMAGGKAFWTSVPQGNQEIAERVGKLIDQHQTI